MATQQQLNPRSRAATGRFARSPRTRSSYVGTRAITAPSSGPTPVDKMGRSKADRPNIPSVRNLSGAIGSQGLIGGVAPGQSASGQFGLLGSAVLDEIMNSTGFGMITPAVQGFGAGALANSIGNQFSVPTNPVGIGIQQFGKASVDPLSMLGKFGSALGNTLAANRARQVGEESLKQNASPELAELEALNSFQKSRKGLGGLGTGIGRAAFGEEAFGGFFADDAQSIQDMFANEVAARPEEYGLRGIPGMLEMGYSMTGTTPEEMEARDRVTGQQDISRPAAFSAGFDTGGPYGPSSIWGGINKQFGSESEVSGPEDGLAPGGHQKEGRGGFSKEAVDKGLGGEEGGDKDSDNEGTVLCTALYMQGMLPKHIYYADSAFGETVNKHVFRAYQIIAGPIARLMIKRKTVAKLVRPIVSKFAYYFASRMGVK